MEKAAWQAPSSSKEISLLTEPQPLLEAGGGAALAQAIVDTIREPLLVLDNEFRVIAASRSFCHVFRNDWKDIYDRPLYKLGDGEWDIPQLRLLLENVAPEHTVMRPSEVERHFTGIGLRTILLSAREVFNPENSKTLILLAIEDVTERRGFERTTADLLQQKELLLHEMQHRVANSLQIIASIIQLKARTVQSTDIRRHLEDTHQRVMSFAAVQQQLHTSIRSEQIDISSYLSRLCKSLAASMIGDSRPVSLKVHVGRGTAPANKVLNLGLIVTELVINALKHAFVDDRAVGLIVVSYNETEAAWKLTVSDYGIGRLKGHIEKGAPGIGTNIIESLARHLDGRVEVSSASHGTTVSIIHGTFAPQLTGAN